MQVQTVWGWPIAIYLFLAGVAAGSYLIAAYWRFSHGENNLITKVGIYLSAPCLGLSIFILWLDLGSRFRFPYAFLRPQESWISIGAWLLTLLFILGALQWLKLFMARKQPSKDADPTWMWIVGIILALLTAIYTGVLLGVVEAIPFWNTAILPVIFLISALSTGIGAVLVTAISFPRLQPEGQDNTESFHRLAKIDAVLIMMEALCLYFYLEISVHAGFAAATSAKMLMGGSLAAVFWLGVAVIGLLIPFLLEFKSLKKEINFKAAKTTVAGLCILIGGLSLRYLILAAGVYETLIPFF